MVKILGLLSLLLMAGCNGAGRVPAFQPVQPVAPLSGKVRAIVTVQNNDGRVRPGDSLVLELKLVNVSSDDAIVYNELEPGRLVVIEILGEDGTYARSPRPPAARAERARTHHYATLPPGGFIGRRYVIPPGDPRWRLRPGKYMVRVVYRNGQVLCPASPFIKAEDVERLEEKAVVPLLMGMVASNVERFEVLGD
ncbi:MAG: hypothetical protein ABIF82_06625 [Planctomycetota bacterium]